MIFFRADGNSITGSGHIMRCLSIADRLREQNEECIFVLADTGAVNLIKDKSYETVILNTDFKNLAGELKQTEKRFKEDAPLAYFVDSYFADREYFRKLSEIAGKTKILTFDDFGKGAFCCDLLIHYGIGGEKRKEQYLRRYKERSIRCPKLLLGGAYAPLREEFANLPVRSINPKVQDVLVLTGGADVSGTTVEMLRYLAGNEKYSGLRFHFVVGKLNPFLDEIEELSLKVPNAVIHKNVSQMQKLMEEADLAISAGGTTLLELCACGTPFVAFVCADNQEEGVKDVIRKTGALYAGDVRKTVGLTKEIFRALDELCADENLRRKISENGQKAVDGNGAFRIAEEILKLTEL